MLRSFRLLLCLCARLFRSRHDLVLENLALRQQLLTLKRQNAKPRLSHLDRLFWVVARRLWSNWKKTLVIVTPKTVVRWHRAGFRLYWRWRSWHQNAAGRKSVSKDLRDFIFRISNRRFPPNRKSRLEARKVWPTEHLGWCGSKSPTPLNRIRPGMIQ